MSKVPMGEISAESKRQAYSAEEMELLRADGKVGARYELDDIVTSGRPGSDVRPSDDPVLVAFRVTISRATDAKEIEKIATACGGLVGELAKATVAINKSRVELEKARIESQLRVRTAATDSRIRILGHICRFVSGIVISATGLWLVQSGASSGAGLTLIGMGLGAMLPLPAKKTK